MASFSNKFYKAVIKFISTSSNSYEVQTVGNEGFFRKIVLRTNDNMVAVPLYASHYLLSNNSDSIFNRNSILNTFVTGATQPFININTMFTDIFMRFDLSYKQLNNGFIRCRINNRNYYINRGFLADDEHVYIFTENIYLNAPNKDRKHFKLKEEHIYINNCVYSVKNDMTKFIVSRLIPCMNTLVESDGIITSRLNTPAYNTFDVPDFQYYYYSPTIEGPCRNHLKISYICNSKMNSTLKGVEAPKIQSFSNEEILSNIIKYLEK